MRKLYVGLLLLWLVAEAQAQSQSLGAGWNAVGFPVQRIDSLSGTAQIAGAVTWTGNAYATTSFDTAGLNAGAGGRRGFYVFATAATAFSYTGSSDNRGNYVDLTSGWNLVSFASHDGTTGPLSLTLSAQVLPQLYDVRTGQTVERPTPGVPYWVFASAAARVTWAGGPTPSPTPPDELTFVPDPGLRVDQASNAAAGVAPDGTVYLYYQDRSRNGRSSLATAADGLTFGAPTVPTSFPYDSRNTQLPDGTWRRYTYDPQTRLLGSLRSSDGANYTSEAGVRYAPQAQDNGTFGVYDSFVDPAGVVVLHYLGDLLGANNLRRAVSRDNGVTFTFDRADILGDAALGGGGRSYVDNKTILLPDGRRRMFCMRMATIYSFVSDAAQATWTLEEGARLAPSSFTEFAVTGLFDPVPVRLPDGRYRVYVTAGLGGTREALVSATTP